MGSDTLAAALDLSFRQTLAGLAALALAVTLVASWGLERTLGTVYPAVVTLGLGVVIGVGVFVAFYLELRRAWPNHEP